MLLRKKEHLAKIVQPLRGLRRATAAGSGGNSPLNDTFGAALPAPRGNRRWIRPSLRLGDRRPGGYSGHVAMRLSRPKWAPASSSCLGRRALQSNGSRTTKAHMGGPPVHQKKRSCSRHQDRAHPRFISQAMRLTPVVRLRVMQSRLRRPLVVDAAWRRHDRVRPRFSLDHLTSRPLTRYERLAFLFAIAIPRSHRSLPPLVRL